MGILRVLFALSVVIFHTGLFSGYNLINQNIAVLSFFIVSGFYMAIVLDTKYVTRPSIKLFYRNRLLRIFPLYMLFLGLTLGFSLLKLFLHIGTPDNAITHYISHAPHQSTLAWIADVINIIFRNLTLIITSDYIVTPHVKYGYLLVQQAWTLQVELLFYALAPLLSRMSSRVFIGLSLGYIIVFFGFAVPHTLFPELTLTYIFLHSFLYFLAGMASYRFVYRTIAKRKISSLIPTILLCAIIVYMLVYQYLPVIVTFPFLDVPDVVYFVVLLASIPFIFHAYRRSSLDAKIGSLSYPIYISHMFILKLISNLPAMKTTSPLKTLIVVLVTLCASYVLVRIVEEPQNRIRRSALPSSTHKSQ